MRAPITLAVVGLGNIARKAHLPVLTSHPEVEIIGLSSRTGRNVDELAAQYRLRLRARTFAEILAARPRAAYLLSATPAHREQAIALMEAGIDVFMEKPLADNLVDAEAIAEAAGRTGRLLMVGFNRRYAPAYRRAKALFHDSGRRIEYVLVQKHRTGGGTRWPLRFYVTDDVIHIIDLARFFAGDLQLRTACARTGLVAAQMESADATLVQLSQSFSAGAVTERVELHGGGLTVIVEEMERLVVREDGAERVEPLFGSWTPTLQKRGIAPELEHFLACLREGRTPETSVAEALATQRLAEEILRAAGG
ncbi:Gfo/Idh/MocA family protein [Symbiobacterium thermophilum]|uniref:Putative oxidoreductase n=2 Tax=Symbiobacterium thermophilum TaxID=2734 RepID=Q67KL4_SYMTH|nr:Gfo/Idh/MocA family oxidoreductase [Symbiobacterium thermophilum]BAD41784.1 putative oxidoreductase [Symbiobacterium thermophilum IAM 14863]